MPLGCIPCPAAFILMYLLYLDDSGSVNNPQDRHIVLAGVCVYERQPHWLSEQMDSIAARIWPDNPSELEFRGADILGGKKQWRGIPKDERLQAYRDALHALTMAHDTRLFGASIHKSSISPDDPMEYAFEQICNRFDRFLGRLHHANNTQRGLIILDESSYETTLQGLAVNFRSEGHRWGQTYNICDVPLFVNSKATRMIQYADLVAHGLRRYHERGESHLFDIAKDHFDAVGGVVHGLYHRIPIGEMCNCYCCSRKPSLRGLPSQNSN